MRILEILLELSLRPLQMLVKKISKPFAMKIQILTVGEQRAKVMGKAKVASIFKKGKEAIRKRRKT